MQLKGKIYIGGDHVSHDLKKSLKKFMEDEGMEFTDLGVFEGDEIEYPEIAREVAVKVAEEQGSFGILVFGKM